MARKFEDLSAEEQKGFSLSRGARFNIFAAAKEQQAFVTKLDAPKPKPVKTSRPTPRAERPRGRRTTDEGAKSLLGGRKKPRVGLGS